MIVAIAQNSSAPKIVLNAFKDVEAHQPHIHSIAFRSAYTCRADAAANQMPDIQKRLIVCVHIGIFWEENIDGIVFTQFRVMRYKITNEFPFFATKMLRIYANFSHKILCVLIVSLTDI